ncbi:MAG: membrane protein insertion efficiency factor YidD [Spirochaetaceae bacterium]|nr:MAG: membrane protein insertion efficiency factor YidD [Spirochaetaceae bacterium]
MVADQDNHPGPSSDRDGLPTSTVRRWVRLALALPVVVYQRLISPTLPGSCIYSPSCSEYARIAILRHGLAGFALAILRIGRCAGGLYEGGADPVPDRISRAYLFGSYRRRWRGRRWRGRRDQRTP